MDDITAGRQLGEIVNERLGRSRVMEEYGLDYCCGGKRTLEDACAEKGIESNEVIVALRKSDRVSLGTAEKERSQAGMGELVDHIVETHHAYLREELPRLTGLIDKCVQAHEENHPELVRVRDVFASLKLELESHMLKEEQILFPIIKELESASDAPSFHCGSVNNPIRMMEHEHDNAGEALSRLRELTNGYSPPEDVCNTYRAMLDALSGLELDLHEHIHKENNILFPRASAVESSLVGSR